MPLDERHTMFQRLHAQSAEGLHTINCQWLSRGANQEDIDISDIDDTKTCY